MIKSTRKKKRKEKDDKEDKVKERKDLMKKIFFKKGGKAQNRSADGDQ